METKEELNERLLWSIAKKRAKFKKSLITYLIINSFFWIIWFISGDSYNYTSIPWPAWSCLGWGIGVAFQYADAYLFHDKIDSIQKEYEKLKNKGE